MYRSTDAISTRSRTSGIEPLKSDAAGYGTSGERKPQHWGFMRSSGRSHIMLSQQFPHPVQQVAPPHFKVTYHRASRQFRAPYSQFGFGDDITCGPSEWCTQANGATDLTLYYIITYKTLTRTPNYYYNTSPKLYEAALAAWQVRLL